MRLLLFFILIGFTSCAASSTGGVVNNPCAVSDKSEIIVLSQSLTGKGARTCRKCARQFDILPNRCPYDGETLNTK